MNAFQNKHLMQLRKLLLDGKLENQQKAAVQIKCSARTIRRLLVIIKEDGIDFKYSYQEKRYVISKIQNEN